MRSLDPNWASCEVLSVLVCLVVQAEHEEACAQDCEVEDLVTLAAEVEFTWETSFRNAEDVDDGSLNVDVAAKHPKPHVCSHDFCLVE